MQIAPHNRFRRRARSALVAAVAAFGLLASSCGSSSDVTAGSDRGGAANQNRDSATGAATGPQIDVLPGMPPVLDATNLYSEIRAGNLDPKVQDDRFLVYVPNERSGTVTVIDPTTYKVIDTFKTGFIPQHVVPSWDLETLYVLNNNGNSITPIDPATGKPGKNIEIEDPYNLYFTPDGASAIIVAEAFERFDFVDPHTFEHKDSMQLSCEGLNHVDFSIDGKYLVATCEFEGSIVKVDWVGRKTIAKLKVDDTHVAPKGFKPFPMPQDVRVSPDGTKFYIADMISDGVHVIDADSFTQVAFIPTGTGAHGLYPSRDGKKLYVINRGANTFDVRRGKGSISIIDFATDQVEATIPIEGGGSPDMGNFTPDGKEIWLGGRYDHEVYVFNTETRTFTHRIPVGQGPHGLTVWPQPGRYSLGHTGNMR